MDCAHGAMENRIKEKQLGLFTGHQFTAPFAFHLLQPWFSTYGYQLLARLWATALRSPFWQGRRWTPSCCAC